MHEGPSLKGVTERVSTIGVHPIRARGADTNKDSQDLQRRTSQDILELLASRLLL